MICPHCGGVIDDGSVLRAGPYSFSEAGGFRIAGQLLGTHAASHLVLGEIMKARGAIVGVTALRKASGTTAKSDSNIVSVQLNAAKKAMDIEGLVWPIANKWGVGWYWNGPDVVGGPGTS